jgi:hypothetical protein
MNLENLVLVGMIAVFAFMSFIVVMFGGRNIAYRALGASEFRKDLTELTLSWAGILWFCALPMTVATPLFAFVPTFMPYMDDMELAIRLTIVLHLLVTPGLVGIASIIAGSEQKVDV